VPHDIKNKKKKKSMDQSKIRIERPPAQSTAAIKQALCSLRGGFA